MRDVCLAVLVVSFLCYPGLGAQGSTVSGEIVSDDSIDFNSIQLELRDLSNQGPPIDRVNIAPDGRFEMRNVPGGQYMLVVTTLFGESIYRDVVSVIAHDARLRIRLPSNQTKQKPASGVVSIKELTHKPPKEARKAFDKSVSLLEKNDVQGSLHWLRKAVEIDPLFVPAINNLGARYLMKGQLAEAVSCFERAVALDPYAGQSHANLAQALIYQSNLPAAEISARRATEIDPSDPKSAYLLGLSLVMQKKFTQEAVIHLRRGEHVSSRASLALGVALAATGATADARSTLNSCLKSTDPPVRAEAERLLSRLR